MLTYKGFWLLKKFKKHNRKSLRVSLQTDQQKSQNTKLKSSLFIKSLFKSHCAIKDTFSEESSAKIFVRAYQNKKVNSLNANDKKRVFNKKRKGFNLRIKVLNESFRSVYSLFDKKKSLQLFKEFMRGRSTIFFFKKPLKTNVVAADFNFKSKQLVFKKKEVVDTLRLNTFKRKQIFYQINKNLLNLTFKIEHKLLQECFVEKNKYVKFYIQHKAYKKNSLSSNSYQLPFYKEVNYRIKQVTLIPTILKSSASQKNKSNIPTKIPTFFINFLYKHN